MDIVDFIRSAGGVEEIRLAKSPNAMSNKQKAAVATSTVAYKEVAVLSSAALGGLMNDAGKIGTNTVLIGTWQADGSVVAIISLAMSVRRANEQVNKALATSVV